MLQEINVEQNMPIAKSRVTNTTPAFYFVGLITYVLYYANKELIWNIPIFTEYISLFSLSIHFCLVLFKYRGREILGLFLILILVIISGISSKQLLLLYLSYLLVVGTKGISIRNILCVYFLTSISICLISVIGSSIGLIQNKIIQLSLDSMEMLGSGNTDRYCYGYGWPTGCAIHISYICLTYFLFKRGALKLFDFTAFFFAFLFVYIYTQSRQPSVIILFLLMSSVYIKYINKGNGPNNFLMLLLSLSIPLFAVLSIYATLKYDNSNLFWIAANALLTGRLSLGQDAIDTYGFKWFGQEIKMYGADVNDFYYNYVDCSYLQSLLIWGTLLTIVLILVYIIISIRALKSKNISLLFAIFYAGLSSVFSQYLFQLYFCPLLLFAFADSGVNHIKLSNTSK